MNRYFSIVSDIYPDIVLIAIDWDDQEKLRFWKNDNRCSFFDHKIITLNDQKKWFEDYLNRAEDYMFLIKANGESIGCVGFRLKELQWDIYNVILGNASFRGKGYMRKAMRMICSYALSLRSLPVTAKVLIINPALRWYYRNGFRERAVHDDYVDIELDAARFVPSTIKEVV